MTGESMMRVKEREKASECQVVEFHIYTSLFRQKYIDFINFSIKFVNLF